MVKIMSSVYKSYNYTMSLASTHLLQRGWVFNKIRLIGVHQPSLLNIALKFNMEYLVVVVSFNLKEISVMFGYQNYPVADHFKWM